MKRRLSQFVFAVACAGVLTGADWLQFRGNNANGVSSESDVPTSMENIAWSVELTGRGLSGPIVIGDRVVLTSSSGFEQDRLHVRCFSTKTGKELWERQFWATGRTQCHTRISVASSQPASDGKRIFAFYSSNDLACLDLEGNLLWYRGLGYDFPNASNSLGMASSPVVVGKTVVVQVESDAEAFAIGIDVETGLARWRIERPRAANWTSPTVLRGKTRADDLVVLQSSKGLSAVNPMTGEEAWSYQGGASTIPSSVIFENIIYAVSNGITALKPLPDSTAPELVWRNSQLGPATASPIVYQNKLFTVNKAGVLSCADLDKGERQWQLRLDGPFSGTPVAAGGHLFFVSEKGTAQAVDVTGEQGKIVSKHKLDEMILCTPAFSGGALYVRSDKHLWKIAN
jgi:outer membrane protein assembly factor BamB